MEDDGVRATKDGSNPEGARLVGVRGGARLGEGAIDGRGVGSWWGVDVCDVDWGDAGGKGVFEAGGVRVLGVVVPDSEGDDGVDVGSGSR